MTTATNLSATRVHFGARRARTILDLHATYRPHTAWSGHPNSFRHGLSLWEARSLNICLKGVQWWVHCVAERHIVYQLRKVLVLVLLTQQVSFFRQQSDVHLHWHGDDSIMPISIQSACGHHPESANSELERFCK
eukprot:GHUV01035404.1.p1 GENE.GHUV01035404.1~~GHUV01035404.1.p1  ORF type:complete len:135 (-),score=13.78 GHUV01035404.1:675-1079(-)